MTKLVWDKVGERIYETGVRQGVLYPQDVTTGEYQAGVAWNGLTSVSESPSGGEPKPIYADDIKYLNLLSAEEFGATVEAYTYPDEFAACDGSIDVVPGVRVNQQKRQPFGLSYRTVIGNDLEGEDYGYKLHLVYNAMAAPTEKSYETINDSPEAITFSWEITTTPAEVTGYKPTAHLEIDSTKADKDALALLEALLYGDETEEASLPSPDEVIALFAPAGP